MQCVILAAGEGKRMRPLTARRPKVMLPVAGKPILEHLLDRAIGAGFRDFLFLTHYQADAIRSHFGNGQAWKAKIRYVDQGSAGGTGHAAARLKGKVKGTFALLYGDSLFDATDLRRLRDGDGLAVAGKQVPDASAYGLLAVRKDRLVGIEEKPKQARPGLVNAGAYVLDAALVDRCARLTGSPRGEIELTDALAQAAQEETVRVLRFDTWRDIGRPWNLLDTQEELMKQTRRRIQGDVDRGALLEGNVVVEKGARVRAGSVVEGPCIIQRDARVGPMAYVRPSTVIGPSCHVGAHVEIKNSLLMERTNVPHLSYVGDSVLGSGVNLGAGTNVANLKHSRHTVRVRLEDGTLVDTGRRKFGVVIGDDVKTGINTTLNVGSILSTSCQTRPGALIDGYVPPAATVV